MDSVLRAMVLYVFLLFIFRISGKRTLNDLTLFDFVLLLILAETTENALLAKDSSIINGFVLIFALVLADIGISLLKQKSITVQELTESEPLVILQNGELLKERCRKERIGEGDVLEAGRQLHGLERLDQIKYAILEKDGLISIIPKK